MDVKIRVTGEGTSTAECDGYVQCRRGLRATPLVVGYGDNLYAASAPLGLSGIS